MNKSWPVSHSGGSCACTLAAILSPVRHRHRTTPSFQDHGPRITPHPSAACFDYAGAPTYNPAGSRDSKRSNFDWEQSDEEEFLGFDSGIPLVVWSGAVPLGASAGPGSESSGS